LAHTDPARLPTAHQATHINAAQTEVQWRDSTSEWRQGVFDCKPSDLLQCGRDLLDALPGAASVAPLDRTPPRGFLRMDTIQEQIHVWTDLPIYRLVIDTEARWPGWTVELIAEQTARGYSHQPERFSLTGEEIEHAAGFMEARLDHSSTTPFRDALQLYEARARQRNRPA